MKYRKIKPRIGDVIAVSDQMSLRFEKLADDLSPVWMESPYEPSNIHFEDGSYINVTEDFWFVFDNHEWRIMTMAEHQEAYRQSWLNELSGQ